MLTAWSARTLSRSPPRPKACRYERTFPAMKCMERRLYEYTFEFLFYGVQKGTQTQIFFDPFYSVFALGVYNNNTHICYTPMFNELIK